MDPLTSLFLSQSYDDTWADYRRSLMRPDFLCWDYVVLTASNELQAEGFRAQLDRRRGAGLLPAKTHFAVIPDPDGKRVGSGGATLAVIRYIAQVTGSDDFSGLRILVIHSGGDSKRVPQYSALGKLFSPVPHQLPDGRASTLFDEFMITMSSVPGRIPEGMLLLSGDVLLLFNPLQIDSPGSGACAISFKESVEIGKNHGVFLRGQDGNVRKFLHKQTVESLKAQGAVNEQGDVDIDTGSVLFSAAMLRALYSLVCEDGRFSEGRFGRYVNETVRLSLYGDFLYPLATDATLADYYAEKPEGTLCEELLEARRAVWEVLRPFRMKLQRLAPAQFIHFGTIREIMALMSGGIEEYASFGWSRSTASSGSGAALYNSILAPEAAIGTGCYLESSYVHGGASVGDRVLLSNVDVEDEKIPSDVVLHGLKQRNGKFVVRIYGIGDNPKAVLEEGCPFLGEALSAFLEKNGIAPEELWDGADHSLWNARLYPACDTFREAMSAALNIYHMTRGREM